VNDTNYEVSQHEAFFSSYSRPFGLKNFHLESYSQILMLNTQVEIRLKQDSYISVIYTN